MGFDSNINISAWKKMGKISSVAVENHIVVIIIA